GRCHGARLAEPAHRPEAIEAPRRALALEPNLMEAHVNLGIVLDDSGHLDDAMREYDTAIRLRPTPEAYNNVAAILLRQGRPAEAVVALRRGIALRSDGAQLHENLGTALQQLNDREGATAEVREALRLDPSRAATAN